MIQFLTRIEVLGVESLHKEERIKVLGKKIQLLEGVQADKAEEVEEEKVEGAKGKTSTGKGCYTHPEKDWKLRRPLLVKICASTEQEPARGECQDEECWPNLGHSLVQN